MENEKRIACLPEALLPWYQEHHRDLPWRHHRDPYRIWVSEIMLQQTRVEAVKGYYSRFLSALPGIAALAACDDELLHKLWEGLGYYSRVRNLKKAALRVMEEHNGRFPTEYAQVLALPGIGEYTAGAICSIAYDLPTPAVDGNVLRVFARITDDNTPIDRPEFKKKVHDQLSAVYPPEAGAFTQALMELGATLCGPNRAPDCQACPCRAFCLGYANGTAEQLPVKTPKPTRRVADMTVFLLRCGRRYALQKRPETGLLADLWQFPNVPGRLSVPEALAQVEAFGLQPREVVMQIQRKHIFTHVQWNMYGIMVDVAEENTQFTWCDEARITGETALPTAFRQFWEKILQG